jgi:hypothetical protein
VKGEVTDDDKSIPPSGSLPRDVQSGAAVACSQQNPPLALSVVRVSYDHFESLTLYNGLKVILIYRLDIEEKLKGDFDGVIRFS